jgi:hypothetical protein
MSTAVSASGSALILKPSTTASNDTGFASLNSIYPKKRYVQMQLGFDGEKVGTVLASKEDMHATLAANCTD